MPTLFWLALLLGYLTGVAAAVLLLPARLVEPLAGPLTLTTVIAVAAFGVLLRLRQASRLDSDVGATPVAPSKPPAASAAAAHPLRRPEVEVDAPEPAAEARWPLRVGLEPPGAIGPRELQRLLAEGRVDVGLRPIARLEQPEAAVYHALPRLHAADDSPIAPARYRASAARCGLLGLIDQRLVRRSAELLRKARAEGCQVMMVCTIAAESLSNPVFGAELEQQLKDDPQFAAQLVLALDQAVRDQPGLAALARLRLAGMRFCLRRVGPPALEPAELGASGFEFVLLEAARFALRAPDGMIDPALLELRRGFGPGGPMLLVARTGLDEQAIVLPGNWARSADDGAFDLARSHAA